MEREWATTIGLLNFCNFDSGWIIPQMCAPLKNSLIAPSTKLIWCSWSAMLACLKSRSAIDNRHIFQYLMLSMDINTIVESDQIPLLKIIKFQGMCVLKATGGSSITQANKHLLGKNLFIQESSSSPSLLTSVTKAYAHWLQQTCMGQESRSLAKRLTFSNNKSTTCKNAIDLSWAYWKPVRPNS